jgi:hypothetical protein
MDISPEVRRLLPADGLVDRCDETARLFQTQIEVH